MKSKKISALAVTLAIALTLVFTFAACGEQADPSPELVSIKITAPPDKATYTEGESFDPSGMVVKAVYDDGTEETITDYMYEPNGELSVDDTFVTVSYGGKKATQAITVNSAEPEAPELVSIKITTPPDKTTYTEGESFDPSGMVVKAVYDDGTEKVITDYIFMPSGALAVGNASVTVSYNGKNATQAITVNSAEPEAPELVSIKITAPPDKTTYTEGESFDPSGMVVKAVYDDGSETVVRDYAYEPEGALTVDDTFVTVSYSGKTVKQTIKVNAEIRETYRIEAESVRVAGSVAQYTCGNKNETYTDGVSSVSGMGYLGNTGGGTLTFSVDSDKAADAWLYVYADRGAGVSLDPVGFLSSVTVKSDGGDCTADIMSSKAAGINWYTWQKIELCKIALSAGTNEISVAMNVNINIDYFELETSAVLSQSGETDGHAYSDWTVTRAPTAETAGRMYRYCKTCLTKETAELPSLSTPDAYTVGELTEATGQVRGKREYTYHSPDGDLSFVLTESEATGAATVYRLEAEKFALDGLSADAGNTDFIGANNAYGTASATVDISETATVVFGINASKGKAPRYYLADVMRVYIDGKAIAIDDTRYLDIRDSGWYEVVEHDVAVFELEKGTHTIEIELLGMPGGNLDCVTMKTSATLTSGAIAADEA